MPVGAMALPRMAGVSAGGQCVNTNVNSLFHTSGSRSYPRIVITKPELGNEEARMVLPYSSITHF